MNFSVVKGAQTSTLVGEIIQIETDVSRGLSYFQIIGLGDKTVNESRERILGALKNSKLPSPKTKNQRVIVSLLPSNRKKFGSGFDLPIAISYLLASKEIQLSKTEKESILSDTIFVGELSLGGKIKPVSGIIPIILRAQKLGYSNIFLPEKNLPEAKIFSNMNIFPCKNLAQVIDHLKNKTKILSVRNLPIKQNSIRNEIRCSELDYFKINGHEYAKRGMEISIAGGHHIMFCGSPGTGKTFLAKNITNIMPPMNYREYLEHSIIRSSTENNFWNNLKNKRPFRSPHHSSSYASIVGGGSSQIKPGEITLSHNGVLFMDEFPEFNKNIIEALRQPLEDKKISISRADQKITLPANFILIASMNPCPCGYYKSCRKKCSCSVGEIRRYQKKVSGPILDRIDLWINLDDVDYQKLILTNPEINKIKIKKFIKNIERVRNINNKRLGINKNNSEMSFYEINHLMKQESLIKEKINLVSKKLNLSARSYFKIIRVSRTIADLDHSEKIKEKHLMEALQYRPNF